MSCKVFSCRHKGREIKPYCSRWFPVLSTRVYHARHFLSNREHSHAYVRHSLLPQPRSLHDSHHPASPVMWSDPFASCGGRTCLYSSCSQAGRAEKTDYRITLVKCQHDATQVAKRHASKAAARV